MANKVVDEMEEEGVHLMMNTTIKTVEKLGDKLFEVELETKRGKTSYTEKVQVNTILMAIGRDPIPENFGADKAGIELDKGSRKIVGRSEEPERTSIDHIYAVGDTVYGIPELMPVAQKSGRLLAHRVKLRMNRKDSSGDPIVEE
jgi:pyruvate/2-oxoglutarate dehydrogenase complex dihydrolipoamide dehydrogenase (E3) component